MIKTRSLPIGKVIPNPDQPRKYFAPELIAELAESIKQVGLMQPIMVRPIEETDTFGIIAGERRYRACCEAGLTKIECRIVEGLSEDDAFVLAVTENINRADMTIVEEARSFEVLLNRNRTPDDVGKLFGKTGTYVSYRTDMLRLRDDLLHLLDRQQLKPVVAHSISRLDANGQAEVIRKMNDGTLTTTWEIERFAKSLFDKDNQLGMFAPAQTGMSLEAAAKAKKTLRTTWERVEAATSLLKPLLEMSELELVTALGAETSLYKARMEELEKMAMKVKIRMYAAEASYRATLLIPADPVATAAD